MTAAQHIALVQAALRQFKHAEFKECSEEPAQFISNPATGSIGIGCLKCMRVIPISMREEIPESMIEQPKPRFKVP